MLEHGGNLSLAAATHQIPIGEWLDLSTGINPKGWQLPPIPAECWQRLPDSGDCLIASAQNYYQCPEILPVAGSQAAIQALPLLRSRAKVGILAPTYNEHAHCWQQAGHQVIALKSAQIPAQLSQLQVLLIVNPNNPTAETFSRQQLLDWHCQLQKQQGWLIIDEAFIDPTPNHSLASHTLPGLIILRSLGKFFGLAGIRCGFVIARPSILQALAQKLGPWTIATPSRFVATHALQDHTWQQQTRNYLHHSATQLATTLNQNDLPPSASTSLFHYLATPDASKIHQHLASLAILTRLFANPPALRFGLCKNTAQILRLHRALGGKSCVSHEHSSPHLIGKTF